MASDAIRQKMIKVIQSQQIDPKTSQIKHVMFLIFVLEINTLTQKPKPSSSM